MAKKQAKSALIKTNIEKGLRFMIKGGSKKKDLVILLNPNLSSKLGLFSYFEGVRLVTDKEVYRANCYLIDKSVAPIKKIIKTKRGKNNGR